MEKTENRSIGLNKNVTRVIKGSIFSIIISYLSQNLAEAAKQRSPFLFLPASRAENLCLNRQRRTKPYRTLHD